MSELEAIKNAPFVATAFGVSVDALFYALVIVSGAMVLLVSTLIVVFCVRYRRGRAADRSTGRFYGRHLEYVWIGLPLLIFLSFFAWGASVFMELQKIPENSLRIQGVAKQWMWKFYHPGGQREINTLHLPVGRPIVVQLASEDVVHSFFVPHFRIKQDVVPGRYTHVWFQIDKPGLYRLFCAEYCGTEHSQMRGAVRALSATDYSRWLDSRNPAQSLTRAGEQLFRRLGCSGCHAEPSTVHAPDLTGLFGRVVHLSDGRRIEADRAYIRDSILLPEKDIVAGYEAIMPSFAGQLSEEETLKLVSYIRSLNSSGTAP